MNTRRVAVRSSAWLAVAVIWIGTTIRDKTHLQKREIDNQPAGAAGMETLDRRALHVRPPLRFAGPSLHENPASSLSSRLRG